MAESRSYHLVDMICLECGNALLYVSRHVCDYSGMIPTWEQESGRLQYDTPRV